jgi:uncharacterized membrane protein (DUF373 family)
MKTPRCYGRRFGGSDESDRRDGSDNIMLKSNKILQYLNKIANGFEFVIAIVLLIIIAIKVFEMVADLTGFPIIIIAGDFERILSAAFVLVIGVEFTKMLCKHTAETVIDVLVFALARQTVIYHESNADMLIGVVAIAGLFAAKRFLLNKNQNTQGGDKQDKKIELL